MIIPMLIAFRFFFGTAIMPYHIHRPDAGDFKIEDSSQQATGNALAVAVKVKHVYGEKSNKILADPSA